MARILVIAPYQGLKDLFLDVNAELNKDIHVEVGDLYKGLAIANNLQNEGFDVIISRGATARLLREHCQIPVVEVKISGYDILRSLTLVKGFPGKIGLMSYLNTIQGADAIGTLLEMNLTFFPIREEKEIESQIKLALKEGIEVIIGDVISTSIARQFGLRALLITSGKEAVMESIVEAEHMAFYTKKEKRQREYFEGFFQSFPEGLVAMDQNERILFLNSKAEEYLHIKEADAVGRKVKEVIPFPERTGRIPFTRNTHASEVIDWNGEEYVVYLFPLADKENSAGIGLLMQPSSKIQMTESLIRHRLAKKDHPALLHFNQLVAASPSMKKTVQEARRFSKADSHLFIYGEPGSGKQSLAQAIHNASRRRDFPFLFLNCEAYSEKQLEEEIFGREDKPGRKGVFELAHRGTLFLDAIGEMPLSIQAKLINILQEKKVCRLNGGTPVSVDVRLMAAYKKNLADRVKSGEFREDLFYLLNGGILEIPPLRERKEDIAELVRWFIASSNLKLGKQIVGFRPDVMNMLQQSDWPGNVQQLKTTVEKMCMAGSGPFVEMEEVKHILTDLLTTKVTEPSGIVVIDLRGKNLEQIEWEIIQQVLEEEGHNQSQAAKRLGINRSTLWRKIKNR